MTIIRRKTHEDIACFTTHTHTHNIMTLRNIAELKVIDLEKSPIYMTTCKGLLKNNILYTQMVHPDNTKQYISIKFISVYTVHFKNARVKYK